MRLQARNLTVLLMLLGLAACAPGGSSPCNDQLLSRFENTGIASFSEEWMTATYTNDWMASIEKMEWRISERGPDGCIVSLVAKVNSVEHTEPIYYINLAESRVYADDYAASQLALMGPPEWLQIEAP